MKLLNQVEIAQKLGVSQATVSRIIKQYSKDDELKDVLVKVKKSYRLKEEGLPIIQKFVSHSVIRTDDLIKENERLKEEKNNLIQQINNKDEMINLQKDMINNLKINLDDFKNTILKLEEKEKYLLTQIEEFDSLSFWQRLTYNKKRK